MTRLLAAAEQLTTRNRKLRNLHNNLSVQVIALLSADLLKNTPAWHEQVKSMQSIFNKEEA